MLYWLYLLYKDLIACINLFTLYRVIPGTQLPFYSNSHVTQTRAFLKTLTLPALLVMMLMMHDRDVLIPVSVCACSLDFKSELSYCSKYLYKKTSKFTTIFVFILYYYYDSYYKYQYCFKKHIDDSPFFLESYFSTSRALYRFT